MTQEQLIEHLEKGSDVFKNETIKEAFQAIDRKAFVQPDYHIEAYEDYPLPTLQGQTISQPYTVAYMLELLQPQPGHKILDIGSGSGWQTALLAYMVGTAGKVIALEIIPELCELGKRNVDTYNFLKKGIVEMRCQSGLKGYPPEAPYDGIIAAAAGISVPDAWLTQTKVGGRIVCPIGSSITVLTKKTADAWEREDHPGFVFVPLVSELHEQ